MQDGYCQADVLSAEVLVVHPQYLLPAQVPTVPWVLPSLCPKLYAASCRLASSADTAWPCCATTYMPKSIQSNLFPGADAANGALQYLCAEPAEAPLLRTVSSMGNGQDSWAVSQSRTPSAGVDTISDFAPGRLGVQVLFPPALPA